nr:MAG TPA: hypothetical protein [Bacteriophage sp.]
MKPNIQNLISIYFLLKKIIYQHSFIKKPVKKSL